MADGEYLTKTDVTSYSDYGNTTVTTTLTDSLDRVLSSETKDSGGNVVSRVEYTYDEAVNNLYDVVTRR